MLSPEGSRGQGTGGEGSQTREPTGDLTETRLTFIEACCKLGIVFGTIRNGTKFKGRDQKPEPMRNGTEWSYEGSSSGQPRNAQRQHICKYKPSARNECNGYGPVLGQAAGLLLQNQGRGAVNFEDP